MSIAEYSNPWTFNGVEITEPSNYHGFVYILTDTRNGKRYIGKKSFWSKITPKGAKRKKTVESNWRGYYSSSKLIKEIIREHGKDVFKREIIALCELERHMNYLEVKYQFQFNILEQPEQWYNENINGCWYPHLYADVYDKSLINSNISIIAGK